jgi:RsiW-degrading membrane proteinase PrsW (M82 family)
VAVTVQPRPPGDERVRRTPALWVVLALVAAGAVRITVIGGEFLSAYPKATLTATALFALLAVPFWLFLADLDFLEPEPIGMQMLAFGWGALVATSASIAVSPALEGLIGRPGLAGPAVEEVTKTLGIVAIVLIGRDQINSVLDGIVYGAIVGLGFQIVEDIVFAMGAVAQAGHGDSTRPVVATFLLRGFLAGAWSHTLFGALAGAGLGYLVVRRDRGRPRRIGVALLAVLGAWGAHVLWNTPLPGYGLGTGGLALLTVLIFKGLPPLLLILLLVRAAHDREADFYTARLVELDDPSLVTAGEIAALRSGQRRAEARRHARLRAGPKAQASVRRLQRAQARLAVELSRCPEVPDERWRTAVHEQRAILAGLGVAEAVMPPDGAGAWRHRAETALAVAVGIAVLWVALRALSGS